MNWAPAQSSAQLREPGLWRTDPYVERYHVASTSLIIIALNSGDTLTVTDPEGGQVAEVVAFDSEGKPDPGALGADRGSRHDEWLRLGREHQWRGAIAAGWGRDLGRHLEPALHFRATGFALGR